TPPASASMWKIIPSWKIDPPHRGSGYHGGVNHHIVRVSHRSSKLIRTAAYAISPRPRVASGQRTRLEAEFGPQPGNVPGRLHAVLRLLDLAVAVDDER